MGNIHFYINLIMKIVFSRAVAALLASAVYVDGECAVQPNDNGVVTIPRSWTQIPKHAFSFCYELKSVEIPKRVTKILDFAFQSSGLVEVKFRLGGRLKKIGKSAFKETMITSVMIPKSVTKILSFAFWSAPLLEVRFAPNSALRAIHSEAFDKTELKSINIPTCVNIVGEAFGTTGCNDTMIFVAGNIVRDCNVTESLKCTSAPSSIPTILSSTPTRTAKPTKTHSPSSIPSISVKPTKSNIPSSIPSISSKPTKTHTREPTYYPTKSPTYYPTYVPTSPTESPTYNPTKSPTFFPTYALALPTAVPAVPTQTQVNIAPTQTQNGENETPVTEEKAVEQKETQTQNEKNDTPAEEEKASEKKEKQTENEETRHQQR